jgi:hypothetical protein
MEAIRTAPHRDARPDAARSPGRMRAAALWADRAGSHLLRGPRRAQLRAARCGDTPPAGRCQIRANLPGCESDRRTFCHLQDLPSGVIYEKAHADDRIGWRRIGRTHSPRRAGAIRVREELLDHDYKELTISSARHAACARSQRSAAHLAARRLHADCAAQHRRQLHRDAVSGAQRRVKLQRHWSHRLRCWSSSQREFPDVVALHAGSRREFMPHPQGQLGTVHSRALAHRRTVLLLGDAAHAIVPFHGQGMNAAFEDCAGAR